MNKQTDQNWKSIMGLALGLPSLIFVVFGGAYYLAQKQILSEPVAYILALLIICYNFYLMFRYAFRK